LSDHARPTTARTDREAEEAGRPLDPAVRLAARKTWSAPIVDRLFKWAHEQKPLALPKSPVGKALTYMLNQDALHRFLDDGALEMENNHAERELRQAVLGGAVTGRKNYLFAGSDVGAAAAAIHYSLVVSCKELGADPLAYYTDVLPKLATRLTRDEIVALTPRDWVAARARARAPWLGSPPVRSSAATPSGHGIGRPTRWLESCGFQVVRPRSRSTRSTTVRDTPRARATPRTLMPSPRRRTSRASSTWRRSRPTWVPRARARRCPSIDLSTTMFRSSSASCGAPHNAELERNLFVARLTEGQRRARALGKHVGQPRLEVSAERVLAMKRAGASVRQIAREVGVNRTVVRRVRAAALVA